MSDLVTPFRIAVPDSALEDLRERLLRTRWPDRETVDDWSQGMPLEFLQDLSRYWLDTYDWRAREAYFNTFPQFRTEIDGLGVHFIHAPSPNPDAVPLVLTHGWPGSVVEFLKVIELLRDPASHGGDAADAFHVVCPSLPGYGFSDRPRAAGWGIERIADAWSTLMSRLGYHRYGAQGGDWGGVVARVLASRHRAQLIGMHLNMVVSFPDPDTAADPTDEERDALAAMEHLNAHETGYYIQQATRPQTLGYGLADSPVAQCAWIEKSSGPGPTATGIRLTYSPEMRCSTTSCTIGSPRRQRRRPVCTGRAWPALCSWGPSMFRPDARSFRRRSCGRLVGGRSGISSTSVGGTTRLVEATSPRSSSLVSSSTKSDLFSGWSGDKARQSTTAREVSP